jgi:uncharacterized membrane protein YgdD (TMEM256/DUF423 family)
MRPNWISIGAALGALAVILGAFGAHGLKERIDADALEVWKTGVLYHALHALALVLYGLFARDRGGRIAGWCFVLGIAIFSGTLYGLALGGPRWLGAITPVGGVLLIVGWISFAVEAQRAPRA